MHERDVRIRTTYGGLEGTLADRELYQARVDRFGVAA